VDIGSPCAPAPNISPASPISRIFVGDPPWLREGRSPPPAPGSVASRGSKGAGAMPVVRGGMVTRWSQIAYLLMGD